MSASHHIEWMIDGKALFVGVSGESGAGKTTFVDALIKAHPEIYRRPKSVTTRARREMEGEAEYSFVDSFTFDQLSQSGRLLNADTVYGNSYGILADSLSALQKGAIIPVKEMTFENAIRLKEKDFFVIVVHLDDAYRSDRHPNEPRQPLRLDTEPNLDSDAIVFRPKPDIAEVCARDFHFWLQSSIEFSNHGLSFLLKSHDNDAFNRIGYEHVAGEFTDDLRVTTKFFHSLTLSFWTNIVNQKLRNHESSFLEIGPGRGWLRSVMRWPVESTYRAIDLASKMVDLNEWSHLIDLGSSSKLPYPRASFDGVFGSLIEPSFTPDSLSEIRRVCKPGGWFAFTVPAGEWAAALRTPSSSLHRTSFMLKNGQMAEVGSPCLTAATIHDCLKMSGYRNIQIITNEVNEIDVVQAPPAIRAAYASKARDSGTLPITHCILATNE